jgi:hypothetical protein
MYPQPIQITATCFSQAVGISLALFSWLGYSTMRGPTNMNSSESHLYNTGAVCGTQTVLIDTGAVWRAGAVWGTSPMHGLGAFWATSKQSVAENVKAAVYGDQ